MKACDGVARGMEVGDPPGDLPEGHFCFNVGLNHSRPLGFCVTCS